MGPFIKSKNNTTKMMINVIIALLPIILFSFYKNGIALYQKGYTDFIGMFYPLIFIFIGAFATFTFEMIYELLFGKKEEKLLDIIRGSYSYMPGIFLSLVLPINTPITILLCGCFFASIIGKMIFGGFGKNIFNPALIGALFVVSIYSLAITNNGGYLNAYELDTISSATPLSNYSTISGIGTYDSTIKPYGSLLNFFIGTIPGSVGETSALLCIVAFIFLTITKTIKWRIPVAYVGTVFAISFIISIIYETGIWFPLFQILSGGLLFGAVFMATDPVTSPVTKKAQVLYGICLGIITIACRFLTNYPEGVLTSILVMNMFVFMLDECISFSRFDKKKLIVPILVTILLFSITTFAVYKKLSVSEDIDPNYSIINVEVKNNYVKYTVTEKGYSSDIKLDIIFENNKISKATLISQNDSFFQKVLDADYINKLVNSDNILECDTVSGATISSAAVKKAFINTLNDFKKGGYKEFDKSNVIVNEQQDFVINDIIEESDKTIYDVTKKSFGGKMNLIVTLSDYKVIKIEIKNHDDTYIYKLENEQYFDKIISGQDNLSSVDTVSGATISSKALKEAIEKILINVGEVNEG